MRFEKLVSIILAYILTAHFSGIYPQSQPVKNFPGTWKDRYPVIGKNVESFGPPYLEGCQVLPADNIWNTPVETLPVEAQSNAYIQTIGPSNHVHPDFGSGTWPPENGFPIGIPYNIVTSDQQGLEVDFLYDHESDPGLYPIPENPLIEGNPNSGDRHILVLDKDDCTASHLPLNKIRKHQ